MKTIVVCSGGLDSVTLAHKVAGESTLTRLLSFDYGQRHKKELEYARHCATRLNVPHDVVDIVAVGRLLTGSALTSGGAVPDGHYAQKTVPDGHYAPETVPDGHYAPETVPDGHYAEETMRVTVVPNRNAIMLAVAFGLAAAEEADAVAAAVHGGDHFIYPDCRPAFVEAFLAMQGQALDGLACVSLYTPFLRVSKADIVGEGVRLGVPFAESWSCYKGGVLHCGRCGTCVERREAFHLAGVDDPTRYEDPDYWVEACRKHRARQLS